MERILKKNFSIAIMMATYNGESYIAEQLDSIINQTNNNWTLFIHDDNSTDNTFDILVEYQKRYGDKIVIITDKTVIGGSSEKNFAAIHKWVSENYKFDYYMFSDQDDYWYEFKIEETLNKMQEIEGEKISPILIHTDLEIVNKHLDNLGDSFFEYRALNPEIHDLNHLLIQNNVTGCTMMWNDTLNQLLDLTSDSVVMHDWWIALVAAAFGQIACLNKATIKYRQHGKNVVGATKVNTVGFIFKRLVGNAHVKETLNLAFFQAESFLQIYNHKLGKAESNLIKSFIEIPYKRKITKIRIIFKNKFLKQGKIQIIGELIFI